MCEYRIAQARADLPHDTRLQILGATYLEPERHFTIPELMARSKRPQPTVAREIDRLTQAGLLHSELRSGRRNVWADTTSPIFDELHSILLETIGPKAVSNTSLVSKASTKR